MIKSAPVIQTAAKKYIVPSTPTNWVKSGKHLRMVNENNDKSAIQNDTPNSFILGGITSAMTTYGSDEMPHVEKNEMDENATMGIQLKALTSQFHILSVM